MKYAAIISVILLVAALIGVGYLYMTATVTVEAVGVVAVEAANQPDVFEDLRQQQENGTVLGTSYVSTPLGGAEDYQFLTYTVRLKNNCFITADMVEVQVTPMDGDILQIGDATAYALTARTTGDITATILTDINMHSVRELNITYYMWGLPFSIKTTYGN